MLLFLIPFCTILITYNYAANSIEKSILRSNSNILYQFFSNVDSVFSEMNMVSVTLTSSPEIQQFTSYSIDELRQPTIDAYNLNKLINTFSHKDFNNVMVLYHNLSKIYDGKNGLSFDEYYHANYKNLISLEQYTRLLNHPYSNYKSEIITLNDDTLNPILGMAFSQSKSHSYRGSPDVTTVVTLSQNRLRQLFASSSIKSDGILMIFDANSKLLAASKAISSDIITSYKKDAQINYSTIDGKKYIVHFFSSKVTGCTYSSAIPVSVFWEQLNELRIVSLICILLCVLLSSFLAWKMAKANYSPITGVLIKIAASTGKVYDKKKNEIDFISDVLINSFDEISVLTKELDLQGDTLRDNFLMHAMLGNLSDDVSNEEEDIYLNHHIILRSDIFGIILMYIEEVDPNKVGDIKLKENQLILQFILSNVLKELCSERHQGFLVLTSPGHYAYIINFSKESSRDQQTSDMYSIAFSCYSFLREHFGIIITCLLSDVHSNLPGIHKSYLETQMALDYRFMYGKGSIISYSKIKNREFDFTGVEDNKIEYLLHSYIKDVDCPKDSKEIINELQALSGINDMSSIEAIACFKYDLLIHFSRVIHQFGATAIQDGLLLHTNVLQCETFSEVQKYLVGMLNSLRQFYQNSKINFTLCDEVEEYLKENFRNPDVNISMLGNVFDISRSYLSHMFRMQKNISILDFLNHLRIKNAKQLLEHTNETLEDIATKCGFLSSSTFIKLFKKNEGITPGVYRKLKQN